MMMMIKNLEDKPLYLVEAYTYTPSTGKRADASGIFSKSALSSIELFLEFLFIKYPDHYYRHGWVEESPEIITYDS